MGFLGISGNTWKKVGKIALRAAPIIAAPFTGGASLAALAIGAGAGAASGALDGGGWKGALTGGALGAIPGVGGAAGSAVTGTVGKTLLNAGLGAAQGAASGGGVKGTLIGAGLGAAGGARGATGQVASPVTRSLLNAGVGAGTGALTGGGVGALTGAATSFLPTGATGGSATGGTGPTGASSSNVYNSYLPQGSSATPGGTMGMDWTKILGAGLGAYTGAQNGGGWSGAAQGALKNFSAPGAPTGGGGSTGYPGTPPYVGGGRGTEVLPFSSGGGSPTEPTFGGGGGSPGPGGGAGGGTTGDGGTGGEWQGAPVPPGYTPPVKPPTWAERYGPILAQAGGVAAGALVGRQAQQNAMNRSPEEQTALTGAQGAAGQAGQLGGQLAQQGRDYLQKPGEYFQTLLGGNRAAMSQAVAAPTAQLTATYRGAQRNLDQQGIRGASRDVAAADLNRDRASKIAGLTTGVQPYAAEQLAGMGQNTLSQVPSLLNTSGNIYGNLLGQGYNNRVYARGEGASTAKAIGGLARDAGEVVFKRPQAGGTSTPDKPTQGGPPPKKPVAGQTAPPPTDAPPTNTPSLPPPTPFPFGGLPGTGAGTLSGPGDYDPNRQIWT